MLTCVIKVTEILGQSIWVCAIDPSVRCLCTFPCKVSSSHFRAVRELCAYIAASLFVILAHLALARDLPFVATTLLQTTELYQLSLSYSCGMARIYGCFSIH